MKQFILLSLLLSIVAASDSEVELTSHGNLDGLLCALGIVITPIAGTIYALTRCLIKDGAQAFTCIWEDLAVTAIAWFGTTAATCLVF